ncbi:glycosyltransferase family 2 protein [Ochrobactrum sp. AP1BH01-1]|nr:glycosyltransferase family 2 protein [Ochrobactrum sp. AP1BH01-1]
MLTIDKVEKSMNECVSINDRPLLTISVVTFDPNFVELRQTLDSLTIALKKIEKCSFLLTIIDNSAGNSVSIFLAENYRHLPIRLLHGHGNIGFGRAHNLALDTLGKFHLILNPDIQLHPEALANAVAFMNANQKCGLISPYAEWPDGVRQYLCKRYPSVFDLFLRGFAPKIIRTFFKKRLQRYEMQTETQNNVYWNPPIVSGCLMFFRSQTIIETGGFSDSYFLYFEDFDLSLRVHSFSQIAYVPAVRLIHSGGNTSKKGFWHIRTFIRSAILFYKDHGLKII